MQWGTNHLGHFLLTHKLLPALQQAAPSRVVNVSSMAHQMSPSYTPDIVPPQQHSYNGTSNYGLSKLSNNMLFSREFNRRHGSSGVTSFALHPGVIPTDLGRYSTMANVFYKIGTPFMKVGSAAAARTMLRHSQGTHSSAEHPPRSRHAGVLCPARRPQRLLGVVLRLRHLHKVHA